MQKLLTYSLVLLMSATVILGSGCGRGAIRTRTHKAGDRSVTIVKRPKYKGVPGRTKPILSAPKAIPNHR